MYKGKDVSAKCHFCRDRTIIADKIGTASNFVKHLKPRIT